jgi:HK97 family phage major capsid protein
MDELLKKIAELRTWQEQQYAELKDTVASVKDQFSKGVVSQETLDNTIKQFNAEVAAMKTKMAEVDEQLRKRATVMSGLEDDVEKGKVKFSICRTVMGLFQNKWYDAKGNEVKREDSEEYNIIKEYMDKVSTKDAQSTTGGSGGYSIPPQAIMNFIEKLYSKTVVVEAGARIMTGLTGSPVYIPRQSGSTTAYWIGEGDDITESKISDEQINMTPKECTGLVVVNNKLLKLSASNPSIEDLIVNDLTKQIKRAIDIKALRGDGQSDTPVGVLNAGTGLGTLSLGDDGGYFDFDTALDMEGIVDDADALDGKLAYITHGKIIRRLKKRKIPMYSGDSGGLPLLWPMNDQNVRDSLGYSFHTTTKIPTNLTKAGSGAVCSEVYFGNWDDFILAQWGGLDLATSDSAGTAFEKNQIKIRAIQMVDFAIRHPESFCVCTDAKTV